MHLVNLRKIVAFKRFTSTKSLLLLRLPSSHHLVYGQYHEIAFSASLWEALRPGQNWGCMQPMSLMGRKGKGPGSIRISIDSITILIGGLLHGELTETFIKKICWRGGIESILFLCWRRYIEIFLIQLPCHWRHWILPGWLRHNQHIFQLLVMLFPRMMRGLRAWQRPAHAATEWSLKQHGERNSNRDARENASIPILKN